MKKIVLTLIVLLSLVAAIFGGLATGQGSDDNENKAVVTLTSGHVTELVSAMGLLAPRNTVSIKSQIRGIVTSLYHDEGDAVSKHSRLLEVRPEPTPEEYAKYKQDLALTTVKRKSAEQNYQRQKTLLANQLVAQQDFDDAKEVFEEAKLAQQLAQDSVNLIETGRATVAGKDIENTVKSPIAGYVLRRMVEVGDAVVPLSDAQEGTVLFTVAQMDDIVFKGAVNEIDVGKLKEGMSAKITVAALPDLALSGTVHRIALQSEGYEPNVSFAEDEQQQARFRIDIEDLKLPKEIDIRAGFSATAEIELAAAKDVVLIPEYLLNYADDEISVMKKTGKNFAKQVVTLGVSDGINAEVLTGLAVGDVVQSTESN